MNCTYPAYAFMLLFALQAYGMDRAREETASAGRDVPTHFTIVSENKCYDLEYGLTSLSGPTIAIIKLDQEVIRLLTIMYDKTSTEEHKKDALAQYAAFYRTRLQKLQAQTVSAKMANRRSEREHRAEILLATALSSITDYTEINWVLMNLSKRREFSNKYQIEFGHF